MSYTNFVQLKLAAAATAAQTTLVVTTPAAPFAVPAANGSLALLDIPDAPTKAEIVTYTTVTNNGDGTHTLGGVVRAREGTAAQAWAIGAGVFQSLTAAQYAADLGSKEPSITAGAASQMWLGNKTWASVLSQVQGTLLTGYSVGANAVLAAGDSVLGAFGKIQGQLNGKQPTHANLAALSGLVGAADKLPYFTGAGALSVATLTAKARALLASTDEGAMRTFLGLNTAAVAALTTSAYDTTAGRVLKVGDYGLGGFTSDLTAAQIDATRTGGVVSAAAEGWSPYSSILTLGYHSVGYATQISSLQGVNYPHLRVRSLNTNVWGQSVTLMHTGNILGAVGQSGGLPTGAIIERGSNANGEYVRYADGTQWVYFSETTVRTTNQQAGTTPFWNVPMVTLTFPAVFITAPEVTPIFYREAGAITHYGTVRKDTMTGSSVGIGGCSANSSSTGRLGYIAIGRWF